MDAQIWVINTENTCFEVFNSSENSLYIARNFNYKLIKDCNEFDIIYFSKNGTAIIAQKSDNYEKSNYIIWSIYNRLNEKVLLIQQLNELTLIKNYDKRVLIKMQIMLKLDKKIKTDFFSIKIADILNTKSIPK